MKFSESELDTISRALVIYKLFIHNHKAYVNKRITIKDLKNMISIANKLEGS